MDDQELAKRLKGFEAVWKRVGGAKAAAPSPAGPDLRLMPGKQGRRPAPRYKA